jgi:uncharacterized membrane protein
VGQTIAFGGLPTLRQSRIKNHSGSDFARSGNQAQAALEHCSCLQHFPVFFMGAMGGEEGAFLGTGLALICLVQTAYPTPLGWTLVTVVYLFCSAIFVYLTIADLIKLVRGVEAGIFINRSPSALAPTQPSKPRRHE